MGVNWMFAPVADVNNNPDNPIINIRSFGEDPAAGRKVRSGLHRGRAFGQTKNPVLVTAKHFPGHGDTAEDSHLALPRLDADRDRIEAVELEPFRAAIAAGVDAIMTAHLTVPALEPDELPATVSCKILTGVLREELGFQRHRRHGRDGHAGSGRDVRYSRSIRSRDRSGQRRAADAQAAGRSHQRRGGGGGKGRISRQRLDESVVEVLAAKVRLGLRRKQRSGSGGDRGRGGFARSPKSAPSKSPIAQ